MENDVRIKRIQMFSAITTGFFVLLSLCSLAGSISLFVIFETMGDYAKKGMDYVTNVDPESIVAGYQVIGGLFGTLALGVATGVVLFGGILAAILFVNYVIPIIVYAVILIIYKEKKDIRCYKVDGIVKIVFNAMPSIVLSLLLFDEFSIFLFLIFLLFGTMMGLNIKELMLIGEVLDNEK